MFDLTVLIRVFNCASSIGSLITQLSELHQPDDFRTEFLFVDNNSSDQTVAKILSQGSSLPGPVRTVIEERPGAAFARLRGFNEARGRYIACLDDDNFPAEDWLEQIKRAIEKRPEATAFSGKIRAQTSEPVPDHIRPYLQFYAVIDRGEQDFCFNQHPHNLLPPGAGLVVLREAALDAVKTQPLRLAGPTGSGFYFKGEDIELLRKMQRQGGQIWYSADLVIEHQLEQERFGFDYLEKFIKAIARPRHYHRMLPLSPYMMPVMTLLYGLNDIRKLLGHGLKYERSPDWRLQWVFLWYITISPIYTPAILRGSHHPTPQKTVKLPVQV